MLTRTKSNLNDSHMDIGNLLEDNDDGFDIEKDSLRILPYDNYMHNSLTFELSRTRIDYTRRVNSVFDFIGDIGGFHGALVPTFAGLVYILQYRGSYMFLMQDMLFNDPSLTSSPGKEENSL